MSFTKIKQKLKEFTINAGTDPSINTNEQLKSKLFSIINQIINNNTAYPAISISFFNNHTR